MAIVKGMDETELRRQIVAIQIDATLSEAEKAKKRQALLSGRWLHEKGTDGEESSKEADGKGAASELAGATMFDESLNCTMCMELCNRPITAPCQHNFCLGCFNKWVNQGKKTCPTCRHPFPAKFASNPRINTALAGAIRMAKLGVVQPAANRAFERIDDKDRPDEAFTTDRAVRAGRANAASGRIMVTVPGDWFGPIPPEHDPRGLGVRVGEHWKDRLDCRQWGAHFPHVAGIAGQSNTGAQSVVLSGGYEDDRDEGEWFLYTGSGGRDLSGNKRVTNVQSFDQEFTKMNQALLVSCKKGLPVRVVRSFKEKRSVYAPTEEQPVRYDGIYRIVRAYRKRGNQDWLVCRYLFVRCDNAAAPWSSEDAGDGPWDMRIPQPAQEEIEAADKGMVHSMADSPWWDYDAEKEKWGWARPPPVSQKMGGDGTSETKKARRKVTEHERALREFHCKLCSGVLNQPLSTPCGHHFCKPCIDRVFVGIGDIENRTLNAGRALRERKIAKPCPTCKADIADFLSTAQVNRGMVDAIAKLQEAVQKAALDAVKDADEEAADMEPIAAAGVEIDAPADDAGEGLSADAKLLPPVAPAAEAPAAAEACAAVPQPCAPTAARPKSAKEEAAAKAAVDLDALSSEFPDFDRELLQGMLEDQGGDLQEVHACLRRMKNQTLAAERKVKRAAAAADAGASASAAKSYQGRKPAADRTTAAAIVQNLRVEPDAMDADRNGLADPGDSLHAEPAQPVEEAGGTGGSAAQTAKGGNRKKAVVKKREADAPTAAKGKRSKGTR